MVYLIEFKTCHTLSVGSTETEFGYRFRNYICAHRNFKKNVKIKQESFHAHFGEISHNEEKIWLITLIDQAESSEKLRREESFWQYELDTFYPKGSNDREVALAV